MSTTYVDLATRNQKPKTRNLSGAKWSNGQHQTRNGFPAKGSGPLSNVQKARLCILARQAFERLSTITSQPSTFPEWRRAQQHQATGHESLTTCTQADYLRLVSHFAQLAGEDGQAYTAEIQDSTAEHRIALHKLQVELASRALPIQWAATICRSKFKCALADATPGQLWKLVFDVRNSKHQPAREPKSSVPSAQSSVKKPAPGPLPPKLVITRHNTKPAPPVDEPF